MGSVEVPSGDIPWCENFKSDLAHLPVRLKGGVRILVKRLGQISVLGKSSLQVRPGIG